MPVRYPNLAVINGFIDEYIEHRKISEEASLGGILTHTWQAISNQPNKEARIEKIGKKIIKECAAAHSEIDAYAKAKRWTALLIDIGNDAFDAQQATFKTCSNFCEMLHGLRAYILRFKNFFPEFKECIDEEIAARFALLINKKKERENLQKPGEEKESKKIDTDLNKELAEVDEQRSQTLRELAYLGNCDEILDLTVSERQRLFPRVAFFEAQPNNPLNLYVNFPIILNDNYLQFFINNIFAKQLRSMSVEEVEASFTRKYCEQFGMKDSEYVKNFIAESPLQNNLEQTTSSLVEMNIHASKRRNKKGNVEVQTETAAMVKKV